MTSPTQARFERIATTLDHVVGAGRPQFEALGIVVTDMSNRSGRDWVAVPPSWSFAFVKEAASWPYQFRTTAYVGFSSTLGAESRDTCVATWRAEAWRDAGTNLHESRGSASIGLERLTYGALERLILALLRHAEQSFPDGLDELSGVLVHDFPDAPLPVDHLVEVKHFHSTMVAPWTGPPVGCSEAEVAALCARIGWPLPLAYRQYLRLMGADYSGVFRGSDWFVGSASCNQVNRLLAYNAVDYTPPGDTFEFMWHQGYMVAWFDLPIVGDDPPVRFYSESAKGRVEAFLHFTDFVLAELKHMSHFTRRVRERLDGAA